MKGYIDKPDLLAALEGSSFSSSSEPGYYGIGCRIEGYKIGGV